jgi:uncharacterized membrane protein YcgQ (UPF0703/DUF1980 family)
MMSENKSSIIVLIIALAIIALTTPFLVISNVKKTAPVAASVPSPSPSPAEESISFQRPAFNDGTIEIKEKMFAAQVSDVYLNAEDYLGKTIKLEGLFKSELYDGKDEPYRFVIRYGPGGCCGMDANVGFEVAWDKDSAKPYPAVDSWVEATGVLKTYEEDGYSNYLYLDLSSLNVLSRRGEEFVKQ